MAVKCWFEQKEGVVSFSSTLCCAEVDPPCPITSDAAQRKLIVFSFGQGVLAAIGFHVVHTARDHYSHLDPDGNGRGKRKQKMKQGRHSRYSVGEEDDFPNFGLDVYESLEYHGVEAGVERIVGRQTAVSFDCSFGIGCKLRAHEHQ
eukprot:TRINITY_DN30876_c0_g1_i1.p1 TRINITY_DN30876_c0_g1~~TRINITY_DN30876_c0_g1_i1.p1  ORF type:complete len:147 (+),score=19.00 TRINITY_DN30876_c0_g1_i1:135-575(+)